MSRRKKKAGGGLVYSTEHGRMCPTCGWPTAKCACSKGSAVQAPASKSKDGVVRVERQTQGRKGKGVTVIRGVPLPPDELAQLGKKLKKMCGSGGTVKDGIIEIQGEHRDRLVTELSKYGWKVKKAGG